MEQVDADYDPDFLRHIFPRLEWKALREAAATLGTAISTRSPVQMGLAVAPAISVVDAVDEALLHLAFGVPNARIAENNLITAPIKLLLQ